MANTGNNQQDGNDAESKWKRKHYNVQLVIAIGGFLGLAILIAQWWQMRNTLRIDQRAWVATDGVAGTLVAGGEPFVARVTFKNTGKTFALRTKMHVEADLVAKGTYPDFDSVLAAQEKPEITYSVFILAPNADFEGRSEPLKDSPFTEEQIQNIRDTQDLYVSGRIMYRDIFGHDHWTTFCWKYSFKGNEWMFSDKFNEADNN